MPCGFAATTSMSVTRQLSSKGFQPFLPQIRTWSRRLGTKRPISTPMFPGYLFVRDALDKDRYIDLLKVQGVVRVLEDGWSRLTPVPDDGHRRDSADHRRRTSWCSRTRTCGAGERVRVLEGPLAGVEGIFVHDKPSKGRLVVSVNMLGRSIAVEMDGADVEACCGSRPGSS